MGSFRGFKQTSDVWKWLFHGNIGPLLRQKLKLASTANLGLSLGGGGCRFCILVRKYLLLVHTFYYFASDCSPND